MTTLSSFVVGFELLLPVLDTGCWRSWVRRSTDHRTILLQFSFHLLRSSISLDRPWVQAGSVCFER